MVGWWWTWRGPHIVGKYMCRVGGLVHPQTRCVASAPLSPSKLIRWHWQNTNSLLLGHQAQHSDPQIPNFKLLDFVPSNHFIITRLYSFASVKKRVINNSINSVNEILLIFYELKFKWNTLKLNLVNVRYKFNQFFINTRRIGIIYYQWFLSNWSGCFKTSKIEFVNSDWLQIFQSKNSFWNTL